MSRSVFEDGRILRTSDFVADQVQHLAAHRTHNRTAHSWGIVRGLEILDSDGEQVVQDGHAIDGYGRDVVLDVRRTLDVRTFLLRGIEAIDVWLVYAQVPLASGGDGLDRIRDTAAIELRPASDADPRTPPDDAADSGPLPPDDPARRWPILLGRIILDLFNPDKPPEIRMAGRPYAGLVGAKVTAPTGDTWLDLGATTAGTLRIGVPGPDTQVEVDAAGVHLGLPLTVKGGLVLQGGSVAVVPEESDATPTSASALAGPAAPVTPEWSIGHAADGVVHELRVALPPGEAGVSNRLVVGAWRDGEFTPSLVVDEHGTMVIAGNLIVRGHLEAASVQQAELSDQAKAFLAGIQPNSLLSLFAAPTFSPIN
uniref:hypothetical protein n=1 Tax=Paractinoplanes polyasparticus TaxID=2856853 RepID=UPI001C8604EA|nr:hypothetical protein [Actinoplanes polyasparticus]